jgi:hypothetical protein
VSIIRKIAVGPDLKSGAMHYVVGQPILDKSWSIHLIQMNEEGFITIWIQSQAEEILAWKGFTPSMPISIEYNIDF